MSDFPYGGSIKEARTWLDKNGCKDAFVDWKADAILNLSKKMILAQVCGEKGMSLYGLLKQARNKAGKQ